MFFTCLKDTETSKHTTNLYEIHFDKPFIAIKRHDDLLTPLILIHYLQTLKGVVHKGLKKSYYPKSENLNSRIKGRIDISKTLKLNVFKNKPLYHYCHYNEFGLNNIENRILKKALLFCQKAISDYSNEPKDQKDWAKHTQPLFNYCLPAFSMVDEKIELHELKHSRRNAFYREYDEAIRLARLILRRFGYNIKNTEAINDEVKVPPFWIDMANLFELYVLKLLKEKYGSNTLYHKKGNHGETDFLHKNLNIIIDAKYKPKYQKEYHIDDIRQLSGYARDKGVLKKLGIDVEEVRENKVIDCLIIYPNQDEKDDICLDDKKEIEGFIQFYKIGIKLPTLDKNFTD